MMLLLIWKLAVRELVGGWVGRSQVGVQRAWSLFMAQYHNQAIKVKIESSREKTLLLCWGQYFESGTV